MKFRKKPVVIDAVQWFPGVEHEAVCDKAGMTCRPGPHIHTLEGAHDVTAGDCKPDIFAATYEPEPAE